MRRVFAAGLFVLASASLSACGTTTDAKAPSAQGGGCSVSGGSSCHGATGQTNMATQPPVASRGSSGSGISASPGSKAGRSGLGGAGGGRGTGAGGRGGAGGGGTH